MQIGEQHQTSPRPTPETMVSGELMDLQPVDGVCHIPPPSAPPQGTTCLQNRHISYGQTVTMGADKTAGIYLADSAIFSRATTVLPYNQLVEIERWFQQAGADDPNAQSKRVTSRRSPIDGEGVFAERPYQKGEIIGFYPGTLVLRKPMPPRLHHHYKKLTKKRWKDIALPLYSIWRHNRTGSIQYQTQADTYIAWSRVKIFNKNIELGIDGQQSNHPLRLLNHRNQANTAALPTVNPKMLQHMRPDGQSYVKVDADLDQCLLIPILALQDIEKDEELTIHYQGYLGYTDDHYLFDDLGKNIVSNPEAMMRQRPGEFPEFIRTIESYPADHTGEATNKSQNKQPAPCQSPKSLTPSELSKQPPTGKTPLDDLFIPLTPIRLYGESDQDFARRQDRLVNRSVAMDSTYTDRPSSDSESDSDWSEDDLPETDPDSDSEPEQLGEDCIGDHGEPSPDDLHISVEESCQPQPDVGPNEPHSQPLPLPDRPAPSGPLPKKRFTTEQSQRQQQDNINIAHRNNLLYRLKTGSPDQYPELIGRLFSLYQTMNQNLLICYQRLCNTLNNKAIAHGLDGEEPEWTPALAYHYLVYHRYIDSQNEQEQYRLMPMIVLKEQVLRCQDGSAASKVEKYCLIWLRHYHFRCKSLAFWLNRYGLKQRDGSRWDLPALYRLIHAHPLSDQEIVAWQGTAISAKSMTIGLWSLTRAGHEKALHLLIRYWVVQAKLSIRCIIARLRIGFNDPIGFLHFDFPWNLSTLRHYIIKNHIIDLNNSALFHRLLPLNSKYLLNTLTPCEKQKLVWKPTEPSGSGLSYSQIKEKLIKDFITDSPDQRGKKLAENLLRIFQKKEASLGHYLTYQNLIALLKNNRIHMDVFTQWSEESIYQLWLSHNILDQTTQYRVMTGKILRSRMDTAEDQEKEIAHFFHSWTKTHSPRILPRILMSSGITNKGEPYSIDDLFTLAFQYNLINNEEYVAACNLWARKTENINKPGNSMVVISKNAVCPQKQKNSEKYPTQYQVNADSPDERFFTPELSRRMRQNKDKGALKQCIEQWLIRASDHNRLSLTYMAEQVSLALMVQSNGSQPDLLKQYRDGFQAEVWNLQGLFQFIMAEGIIDLCRPENFCHLSPTEAYQVLPHASCPAYACYAITQGQPAEFIFGWMDRCQKQLPGFSSMAFCGELARYLVEKKITWPYKHQQIKGKYKDASPQEMQQLKMLLILETMQYQTEFGCQQAPDSLLVLLDLLRINVTGLAPPHILMRLLQDFSIKIPTDGDFPIRVPITVPLELRNGIWDFEGEQLSTVVTICGQAGTVIWGHDNLIKLLALHDQKFSGSQSAVQSQEQGECPPAHC